MTIRSRVERAMTKATRRIIRQMGVMVDLRRKIELEDQADNSSSVAWIKVPDQADPFKVFLEGMTDRHRREIWGLDSRASVTGMVELGRGMQVGDLICPRQGSFLATVFEVVAIQPEDMAGVVRVALKETKARPEYGFV